MARTGRAFPSQRTNFSVRPPQIASAARHFVTWPSDGAITRTIDPARYRGSLSAVLIVWGYTSVGGQPLEAYLRNVTTGNVVGGSGVSISATTKTEGRSAAFGLDPGRCEYRIEYGGIDGSVDHHNFDGGLELTITP